ncbi:hypothetical protein [Pseudonocardia sp. ICBG1293]|uniref:hypothetical protein n=1 Tax=Pseudonocardia sp. ICBG1293 TaxID=2844382 RepID=UPI0027DF1E8E|nr:hypothetical protein [Pseudonocardia sp. ICBG1293]
MQGGHLGEPEQGGRGAGLLAPDVLPHRERLAQHLQPGPGRGQVRRRSGQCVQQGRRRVRPGGQRERHGGTAPQPLADRGVGEAGQRGVDQGVRVLPRDVARAALLGPRDRGQPTDEVRAGDRVQPLDDRAPARRGPAGLGEQHRQDPAAGGQLLGELREVGEVGEAGAVADLGGGVGELGGVDDHRGHRPRRQRRRAPAAGARPGADQTGGVLRPRRVRGQQHRHRRRLARVDRGQRVRGHRERVRPRRAQ